MGGAIPAFVQRTLMDEMLHETGGGHSLPKALAGAVSDTVLRQFRHPGPSGYPHASSPDCTDLGNGTDGCPESVFPKPENRKFR